MELPPKSRFPLLIFAQISPGSTDEIEVTFSLSLRCWPSDPNPQPSLPGDHGHPFQENAAPNLNPSNSPFSESPLLFFLTLLSSTTFFILSLPSAQVSQLKYFSPADRTIPGTGCSQSSGCASRSSSLTTLHTTLSLSNSFSKLSPPLIVFYCRGYMPVFLMIDISTSLP